MTVLLAACEEDVPSCPNAMAHFYGESGCAFYDLSVTPQRRLTENEASLACRELLIAVPDRCQSYFDDWMFCLDGQRAPSTESQCMDCNTEFDALLGCQ